MATLQGAADGLGGVRHDTRAHLGDTPAGGERHARPDGDLERTQLALGAPNGTTTAGPADPAPPAGTERPPAMAAGTMVDDRYRIGDCIGRGAMGEVFRARDLRLDRDVALKFLRTDLAGDLGARARFANEARAAARLSHPAAVIVFDSGTWAGLPYLAMECLPGTTLADEMAAGPLPEPAVRAIALDVAGALQAAHDLGIVHRDVKPANIMMTAEGRAKLGDFGIAWSADRVDQTQTGLVVGTPAYLAPERLHGETATPASDLYSLAVVLYEALTGERPFRGDTPVALARAIHDGDRRPLAEVRPATDERLTAAIDACLAADPDGRPASASLFAGQIRAARSDASPTVVVTAPTMEWRGPAPGPTARTTPDPATAPVPGPSRRPRPLVWVGALLVVVALVAGTAMVLGGRGGDEPATTSPSSTVTATATDVPAPLDDALGQLEASVRP